LGDAPTRVRCDSSPLQRSTRMGSPASARRHRRTDSPRGVVRPFSVLSAIAVAVVSVDRALLRPSAPHGAWSMEPSRARRASRSFPSARHIHSWAFTLLQGVTRDHPSTASRFTRPAPTGTVPLMGFRSLQRSRARRSRFTRRFHPPASCALRVRALSTLCSPSSLPVVSDRAAPGISTFRASFLPQIRRSRELTRALLTLPARSSAR
jgi:hypothetical protein